MIVELHCSLSHESRYRLVVNLTQGLVGAESAPSRMFVCVCVCAVVFASFGCVWFERIINIIGSTSTDNGL